MTEVFELCRMLDERRAKWYKCGGAVFWETHDGAFRYMALPHEEVLKVMTCCSQRSTVMTAAQAIEATLGRGECKVDVLNTGDCAGYECSEYIMYCNAFGHEFGHVLYNEDGDVWMSERPNFCPNCGCEVARNEQ